MEKVVGLCFRKNLPAKVGCDSCPPEQGDMEQAAPEGGAPPAPSGAPAAELDTNPGIPSAFATSLKHSLCFSPFLAAVNPAAGTRL